jgi:carboxyvinyl-carboxyphosphonate phosphorylmutase
MFGGSWLRCVLGGSDIALITLTELAEQMRRMSRAALLPVLVDADHGYATRSMSDDVCRNWKAAGAAASPSRTPCRRLTGRRKPS